MRLIKFTTDSDSTPQVGLIDGEQVVPLASGPQALSAILHAEDFLHKIQACSGRLATADWTSRRSR